MLESTEGEKELLVQLRWKSVTSVTIGGSLNSKVLSSLDTSGQKQKNNPSRRHRNAIHLHSFEAWQLLLLPK